ncbi:carbohydrate kinase family protein [Jiella marina]|uniref:carbohydrate kinase family protein n=1 Tax=Jiella sp. LLJ827 TaxID=2917712 RepID=UPI002100FCAD|nr:carbohydrate kinase family protein [Jiella sp. LLJ827]MCQ0989715.1 carbohydrate kinase family protein [Jiella sp. LLJ827]
MNARISAKQDPAIFVVGAAHFDRRAKANGPYHPGASNPGRLFNTAGGSAFNATVALRALGARVSFVSARGGDGDGKGIASALRDLSVEDYSVTWLDRAMPTYTAILDDRGELVAGIADTSLYDLLGPKLLTRKHVRTGLAGAEAILLDANLPGPTIAALVEAAGDRPVAAIGVSPAKVRRILPVLPRLSAVFLSRAEAAALVEATVATSLRLIGELLSELGVRRAIISDGPLEAALLESGTLRFQRPPIVRPRDVTGAGDTLAAVTLMGDLAGLSWTEAARRGLIAASLRISSEGFPPPDLSRAIDDILPNLQDPTSES